MNEQPEKILPLAMEQHFTIAQVVKMWSWSEDTVIGIFRDEPGVLQSKLPSLRRRKRQHVSLRIPRSVLIRVHEKLQVKGWNV